MVIRSNSSQVFHYKTNPKCDTYARQIHTWTQLTMDTYHDHYTFMMGFGGGLKLKLNPDINHWLRSNDLIWDCCWCCEVDNVMEMSHLKYFVLFKTIAGEKVAILRHEMIILPLLNLQGASPTQPAWEVPHKKCN